MICIWSTAVSSSVLQDTPTITRFQMKITFILFWAAQVPLEIDGKRYDIKTDDIFLIPKGYPVLYNADLKNPWEYMWITFDGEMAEAYLSYAGISPQLPAIHSQIPNQLYLPMIHKILDTSELTFANEIKRVGYLYEILSTLIEMTKYHKNH